MGGRQDLVKDHPRDKVRLNMEVKRRADKIQDEFLFLGYDIRNVLGTPIDKCASKSNKVYSIDLTICERTELLTDFDYDAVGKEKSLHGVALSYEYALSVYQRLPQQEKSSFEILGLAIDKDSIKSLGTQEDVCDKGTDIRWNAKENNLDFFAGFDVATIGYEWISALTNCGLNIEFDLNDYYLLSDYKDALQLKAFAEEQIKEHAPFGVWGIWGVKYL